MTKTNPKKKKFSNKNTPRSLKKKETWRDISTILKLPKKERTKIEQKRVEEYKKRQEELPKFDGECESCGVAIPKSIKYCSSECRRNATKDTIPN